MSSSLVGYSKNAVKNDGVFLYLLFFVILFRTFGNNYFMKNFSLFITSLLSGFFFFLVCRFILNYFLSYEISTSISLFSSILALIFSVKAINKRKDGKETNRKNIEQKEDLILALELLSKTEQKNLFIKAFSKKGLKPERRKKYIFLSEIGALVYVKFDEKVTKADILNIYNHAGFSKAFVLCNKFDDDVINFSKRFIPKIIIKNGDYAYELLKDTELLSLVNLPPSINSVKRTFKLFYKNNAKKFFLFGATFIVLSFFVTLKLYFLIVGVAFLCFSLILALFGSKKNHSEETIY